jgi:hypothetical protein
VTSRRVEEANMNEYGATGLDKFMSEKELSQQVRQLATLKGYSVYHTFLSIYSDVGFPDLCLAKKGRLIFVELKTERGKLSEAQMGWLEILAATGKCDVYLWRPSSWDEICEVLT